MFRLRLSTATFHIVRDAIEWTRVITYAVPWWCSTASPYLIHGLLVPLLKHGFDGSEKRVPVEYLLARCCRVEESTFRDMSPSVSCRLPKVEKCYSCGSFKHAALLSHINIRVG
jgi:hypothetical protein